MRIDYKRLSLLCCIVWAIGACSNPAIAQDRPRTGKLRVIVGGEIDYPPLSFLDSKGEPAGFSVELTHAIARTMGFDAEIRLTPWSDARKALEEGTVDILLGMFYSEERSKVFDFSPPFILISNVIFVRKDSPTVHSIEDLKDKEIIIMRGEIMHDYAAKHHVTDRLLLTETPADALRLLASGKGHCALVARLPGLFWVRELNLSNLMTVGQPIDFYKNCFAVRKGNNLVLANFTEGLEVFTQTGEYQALYDKWLGVLEPFTIIYRQILKYAALILIPLLLILGGSFIWSKTLSRKVRQRTQELLASEEKYRDLVELSGSIILRWKPDGTITFANQFAEKFFGYSRNELLSKNLLGTIIPERDSDDCDLTGLLTAVAREPERFVVNENENVLKDGTRVLVSWSNRPIVDTDGNIIELLSIGHDITFRRDAERLLARSEEQYRCIVETVHEGIWSVDRDYITTFVNQRLCDMLGYVANEMLGRRVDAFMLPEDMAAYAKKIAESIGKRAGLYERRFVRRDGSILWALVSATPIHDADGLFAGSLATLSDITVQKQNVLRIEQSEAKLHALFDNMRQGVFCQRADGTLFDINPAALAMFGLTKEEFVQRTSYSSQWRIVDENETPLAVDQYPSMLALKTGKPVRDRVVGVVNEHTGQYTWMVVNAIPQFYQAEDAPFEVFVTLHDITGRIQAQKKLVESEQQVLALYNEAQRSRKVLLSIMEDDRLAHDALHESEERYRSVVETATDAIITFDSAGKIVLWNRAATHIFGYDSGEIVGAPFAMLFAGALHEQDVISLFSAVAAGVLPTPMTVNEVRALKKNGAEFPIDIAFGIVTQDTLQYITAIVRDITDRKLIEQEALRTAQLVSIGELAAGVAHEINNPIMGVINYAQIMLDDNRAQGGDIEIPVRIIKEGERIAGIVSNLLNLARPVGRDFSAVTVREIFEPACQLMQKHLQLSDIILDVHFPEYLPRVLVFPQKIQQVFINLISNALYALNMRFTGPHADKRLEVRFQELSGVSKKFVRAVFVDYGCGITAEDLSRICNPFFTTKPMGQGTGLGLSICYKIIQEHEGRLLFESKPGEYTRVFVDLPIER